MLFDRLDGTDPLAARVLDALIDRIRDDSCGCL